MYDLIIVGGGPAGLTAAIYAIRKRLNVFLVSQDLGGKTNYRLEIPGMDTHQVIRGLEVVEKFWRELDYLDFARHLERVTAVTKTGETFTVRTAGGAELKARSVIWATGSRVKQLGVPGERRFLGKGLSYSALSYAPLFIDKRAVVIGDGRLALRAVGELGQLAATVHLIAPMHGLLDSPLAQKLAKNPRVVILDRYKVKAIQGDTHADRVVVSSPEGKDAEIATDVVFVELGLLPNSEPLKGLVEMDDEGRVMIDNLNRTTCPGLFAAGDVTTACAEQVLISVGEGAKAALSAFEYLLPTL
ncbi:MAG: FAD-dependent oxidoreductase [Chloroflexota bacterium]